MEKQNKEAVHITPDTLENGYGFPAIPAKEPCISSILDAATSSKETAAMEEPKKETVNTETKDAQKEKYGFFTESAKKIQDSEYNQKTFIVDNLITYGLNVLAGPRKQGKSMFALNLALSIAGNEDFWGRNTEHGHVLFMALEDTGKRTQDRMNSMLHFEDAPENLDFAYAVYRKGSKLAKGLDLYLEERPDTKIVIIDVLQKVRSCRLATDSEYAYDYLEMEPLKKLADNHEIALILITHCTKGRDKNDWVNNIAGGVGITAAADNILMLIKDKEEDENEGTLFITGRDVPETKIAVKFDSDNLEWKCMGTSEEREAKRKKAKYDSNPVVKTIKQLLEKGNGKWQGTVSELLKLGNEIMGSPIAKNFSTLGREINTLEEMFLKDSIQHTRPNPNGGKNGRIHSFTYVDKVPEMPGHPDALSKAISPLTGGFPNETAESQESLSLQIM